MAVSLTDDHKQEITLDSNSMFSDLTSREGANVVVFSGDVRIRQGSLLITANRVRTFRRNGDEIYNLIATSGSGGEDFVHFEQMVDDGYLVSADAKKITYNVDKKQIILEGRAALTQKTDRLTAELIKYNVETGNLDLKGGVTMTFTPAKEETDENTID
ncbi:MAG: lipopolysaccharide transport periplasmic protein LptA [Gammaproteobacteria bacterium]|nr:lipopolysaccharide transport periplasmic protein LptA [Gammaproteobacteria bacterium]